MRTTSWLVQAALDPVHLAFPVADVDRVLRAVAIVPVPQSAGCLLGAIDIAGELVSVFDLRRLLGLPRRPLQPEDRMILLRRPGRCAFVVDRVLGTTEAGPLELGDEFGLQATGVRGFARTRDGVLLVQDVRRLLAFERAIPIEPHA